MRLIGVALALALFCCVARTQNTICGVLNCAVGQGCCHNVTCFSTDLFQCCNSRVVCQQSESCCGTSCYDPATSFCCKNSLVCNLNDQVCCPPDGNGLSATDDCSFLDENAFRLALWQAVCSQGAPCSSVNPTGNGGFNANVWATVVNRFGNVCAVAYSGANFTDQMPSGRLDSAAKAWTANSYSLVNLALSSANLYAQNLPGGIWYGVQFSSPMDAALVNSGDMLSWGGPCNGQLPPLNNTDNATTTQQSFTGADPLCGNFVGGIQTLGGGLALYDANGFLVGGLGIGGDTSCSDHIVAWKMRNQLVLDFIPNGVGAGNTDNIIFPASEPFGHPVCNTETTNLANQLPTQYPVSRRAA